MLIYPDYGDVGLNTYICDPLGRRFKFDDNLLPPVTDATRRATWRSVYGTAIRNELANEGITGMPTGNLLDIVPGLDGWRAV